jgi:hypothetical protein
MAARARPPPQPLLAHGAGVERPPGGWFDEDGWLMSAIAGEILLYNSPFSAENDA